jgi:hypothetical protein
MISGAELKRSRCSISPCIGRPLRRRADSSTRDELGGIKRISRPAGGAEDSAASCDPVSCSRDTSAPRRPAKLSSSY